MNKLKLSSVNSKLTTIYSVMFPYIIILNGYGIGDVSIGLGSFLLVFFVVLALLDWIKSKRSASNMKPIMLLLVLILISLVAFLFEPVIDGSGLLVNLLKMGIWALSTAVLAPTFFDIDQFYRHLRKLCIVCTSYLILQNIAWTLFSLFLPNLFTIGPIHPLYEMYTQETLREYITKTNWTRFASFFSEPAFYGYVMISDVTLLLFLNKKKDLGVKKVLELAFVSIGIVLSTATAATIFLAIVISWYLITSNRVKHFIILLIIAVSAYAILVFSPLKDSDNTVFFLAKLANIDRLGRLGKSYENLAFLNARQWIIGVGLGNTSIIAPTYLNSFATIIISFGISGFVSYIVFVASYIRQRIEIVNVMIVIYLLGSFQGAISFSVYGILIFSIIISVIERKKNSSGSLPSVDVTNEQE